MSDIKFKNTRFNPETEISDFFGLAKQMAGAYGYTADLSLDKKLAQLLRLRVAQKNECAYCIILHSKTSREIGINEAKVDNISSYWNSDLFTEKELSALRYTDAVTVGTHPNFDEIHKDVANHFSEREIAEIAAVVINMNLWTRLKLAQGETPYIG
ncbi:carboxymuconolactone decarboxylase family protein [Galbibacter mesophilus]|uniref:carboxymuconolactone decarboxylase family protein n=1 Tax=Galbibacter mesophilus TaxID=379069 RepID=UPI00191F785F|nr:carboxymuconolactone decarboxylase family protein [Galbibacter mesophilus]MCM5664170.1 carboxymuconolactone decarboxylase family protein [Galbibacter mesophilus]